MVLMNLKNSLIENNSVLGLRRADMRFTGFCKGLTVKDNRLGGKGDGEQGAKLEMYADQGNDANGVPLGIHPDWGVKDSLFANNYIGGNGGGKIIDNANAASTGNLYDNNITDDAFTPVAGSTVKRHVRWNGTVTNT
jgi:hypothetical protein